MISVIAARSPPPVTCARQPRLKGVAPGTVRLAWYSPVEVRRFERELRAFAETLP
jgi:hypothetical protein